MTDLTASPLAARCAAVRQITDAKAVDAAIAEGRVIPADDGMMLDDGITGRLVPREDGPIRPTEAMLDQIDAWPWTGCKPRRDWFERLWDFITGDRA